MNPPATTPSFDWNIPGSRFFVRNCTMRPADAAIFVSARATNPPYKFASDRPCFQGGQVVLAISAGKTGVCGWSTPGSDAAKVVLLGEVLKMRWRGPTPPLRVTSGSTGGLYVFEPPAGGHRYTSRGAGRKVPWVAASKRTHLRAEGWPRRGRLITVRLKRGRALVIRRTARRKYWIRTAASVRLDVGRWEP